jgi:hypothetical protein
VEAHGDEAATDVATAEVPGGGLVAVAKRWRGVDRGLRCLDEVGHCLAEADDAQPDRRPGRRGSGRLVQVIEADELAQLRRAHRPQRERVTDVNADAGCRCSG